MKRVAVLGATGSIGSQTLQVIVQHPDRLKAVALIAHRDAKKLRQLAAPHPEARQLLVEESVAQQAGLPGGMSAVIDAITADDVDLVVISVAGIAGLEPTLAVIDAGKMIALASKEVLVGAGEYVMPRVRERGVLMTPIDSEHSAVFQCVQGIPEGQVDEIILTASGGPFRGRTRAELAQVTIDQALAHPTWRMGGKITIDSATLMNKALETIEARWLFDIPMERVSAVIHPQSIIHSMVRTTDGSVLAQMGWPDMRLPIQYAMLYPERPASGLKPYDPVATPNLTFEPIDHEAFPALRIARESVNAGGTAPCAFNSANEQAVAHFLQGKLGFLQISDVVEEVLSRHSASPVSLEALLATDQWARAEVDRLATAGV